MCGAIRKCAGDASECDHIKYSLGKIAEDGTQIGTYNDQPRWFDISFVGRPADRIPWNLKVASAMPGELHVNDSVKQAEMEGYVLPDSLAIESDGALGKLHIMKKLADSYDRLEAWLFEGSKPAGRDVRTFELRKLAGSSLDDVTISRLREMDPGEAFSALGDAGVVMGAPSFFKYAFGPNYNVVESYVPAVEKYAAEEIRNAVASSTCAEFCNCSRFDAAPDRFLHRPRREGVMAEMSKSAAARGFGTDDAVTSVLSAMARGAEPEFSHERAEKIALAGGVDPAVARRLARKYAMYKIAGVQAVMSGRMGGLLDEDDVIFVSAAQDLVDRKGDAHDDR